jgi:predicted acetyltransferase
MPLGLRPFQINDEAAALCGHAAMKVDDFRLLLDWAEGDQWAEYLARLNDQRRGLNLGEDHVRAALLAADVDGVLVGRTSVRFQLNELLALRGGHIGYCVLPEFRQKGYATEILRQALVIARSEGVTRVLMVCEDDNAASAATIERCGGALDTVVQAGDGDVAFRRYWID